MGTLSGVWVGAIRCLWRRVLCCLLGTNPGTARHRSWLPAPAPDGPLRVITKGWLIRCSREMSATLRSGAYNRARGGQPFVSAGHRSVRHAGQHPGDHRRRQVLYEMVRHLRWPDGVPCPHCDPGEVVKQGRDETEPPRQRYECRSCARRFDDLTDTTFAGHHRDPGSEPIGGSRKRSCRCTWDSSSSCTTPGGEGRPSLKPW
jgi:hypothetical protein